MTKRSLALLIVLSGVFLCACTSETEAKTKNFSTSNLNSGLPEVEYIEDKTVDKSLWNNFTEYSSWYGSESRREVIVALIDVGISEYYVKNKYIYQNQGEIASNNIDDDRNGYVDDVHGWNVIDNNGNVINYNKDSIHASAMLGMLIGENENYSYYGMLTNSNVKIVPVKTLDDNTISGSINNVVKAIKYAETINADIVMMSFSTYANSSELEEAIRGSDMLFVVAAGNEGKELCDTYKVYPACYDCDNIITVAAATNDGKIDANSNYGNVYVDVMAPGENVVCYLGEDRFVFMGGTSFAVPYVVAEAANVACTFEQKLTSKEIKEMIIVEP